MTLPWFSHSTVEMDKIREHGITIQRPFRPRRHYRYSSTYQSKHTPLFLHFPLFLHPYLRTTIVSKVILFMRRKILIFGSILPEFLSSSSKNVLLRSQCNFLEFQSSGKVAKPALFSVPPSPPALEGNEPFYVFAISCVPLLLYLCYYFSYLVLY